MILTLVAVAVFVQSPPQITWTPFTPKDHSFSVEFPGRPHLQIKENRVSLARGQSGFVVAFCEIPASEDPATFLPRAWDQHIATVSYAKEVRKEFGAWQNNPCYEGSYQLGDRLTAKVRLIVAGRTLYQQLATWTGQSYDEAVVERFFDSFKVN